VLLQDRNIEQEVSSADLSGSSRNRKKSNTESGQLPRERKKISAEKPIRAEILNGTGNSAGALCYAQGPKRTAGIGFGGRRNPAGENERQHKKSGPDRALEQEVRRSDQLVGRDEIGSGKRTFERNLGGCKLQNRTKSTRLTQATEEIEQNARSSTDRTHGRRKQPTTETHRAVTKTQI
jgi:hypothetical protein